MRSLKLLSLIAFILYVLATIYYGLSYIRSLSLFKEFAVETPFSRILSLVIPLLLAIMSLVYFFYLRKAEAQGKKVKLALIFSIILLLLPFVLLLLIPFLLIIFPLYNLKAPQITSPWKLCDLDHNGSCNSTDKIIFEKAFGKCRGNKGYVFEADIDGDGCISSADKESFTISLEEK